MKIFVFGSNERGIHGAGAALEARMRHGALQGVPEGFQGLSYAIPTKDYHLQPRALDKIAASVERFKAFAREQHDSEFYVANVGCGLAGFTPEQIAPMFADAPANVVLPRGWEKYR